jgi:hypothetical protein
MAQEIKNTFLKSKMNKDLDDRILPNGEYRDALNISVGRSEDNDVGALENIIGNDLVPGTDLGNGLTIIGAEADNSLDQIFVFLTDYTDPNPLSPTNAPSSSTHYIYSYNNSTGSYTRLVQGEFLNFSTTNRIIGINLIENLLFWTDNRNQPRKININVARAFEPGGISTSAGDYYTEEHQISVAKYSPYQPIDLYNRVNLKAKLGATTTSFDVEGTSRAELLEFINATVVCTETIPPTQGIDFVKVVNISDSFTLPIVTTITVSPAMQQAPATGDFVSLIKSTMTNKNDDQQWPGDPDYLEDKFVRFSYRFKFDDNEYSLMAPFTQIAYIPKQKGYFLNGDENAAYQSTIVGFMENFVQNIGLVIPLPTSANKMISDYKISALEILFRESDGIAVKVLETITTGQISGESGIDNYYAYEYQSRKPYRTLPEAQTVRVYDKVPVRALAQETAGNRIIYGNFRDQHTPPANIDYNCRIAKKSTTGAYNNWIEYPNHSVKRNRNYQVGFVLADKFGRQSPVLLSPVGKTASNNGVFYSGSTIYSPYDALKTDTDVDTWFGDAIQVLVNSPIESEIDSASGTPGLYALKQQNASTGEGFAVTTGLAASGTPSITDSTWTFFLNSTTYPNNVNIPVVGDYLRGARQDFVKVTAITNPNLNRYVVTTDGRVSDTYLRTLDLPSNTPDLKFAYTINDLGWYSYKIVVKQTEQDYYNVYLPGILNGYPGQSREGTDFGGDFPGNEENLTAHAVLFNDNINKIPRDLAEVGPDQKQYRSSAVLYGVVTNIMEGASPGVASNTQYYPRLQSEGQNAISHTSTAIAAANEFDMAFRELSDGSGAFSGARDGNLVFYQIDTIPLIARISTTEKAIGWPNKQSTAVEPYNMLPFLAVYETKAIESLLDIYWETSSTGLIVDLNQDVASTNTGVVGFQDLNWEFKEDTTQGQAVTPSWFSPINNEGEIYIGALTPSLTDIRNGNNDTSNSFDIVSGAIGSVNEGKFQIIYNEDESPIYEQESPTRDVYSFEVTLTEVSSGEVFVIPLTGVQGGFGALENVQPTINNVGLTRDKTPSDQVLIGNILNNATILPKNGSATAGSGQLQGLRFYLIKNPDIPAGNDIPTNWQMDGITGELTQATPGNTEDGYFAGNGLATYNVRLILADTNGSANSSQLAEGYSPLATHVNFSITLKPTPLNSGAKTPTAKCVVDAPGGLPTQIYQNNYDSLFLNQQVNGIVPTLPDGVFGHWKWGSPAGTLGAQVGQSITSCIYYIGNSNPYDSGGGAGNQILSQNKGLNIDLNNSASHPTFYHKIGTDSHTSGVIHFTINTYSPPRDGLVPNVFAVPAARFYYRQPTQDNPNPDWTELQRNQEMNQVGTSGPDFTVSPKKDAPELLESFYSWYTFESETTQSRTISNSQDARGVWVQTMRAFDFDELYDATASGASSAAGIEYAITLYGQQQNRPFSDAQAPGTNLGTVRSYVIADDLNFPTCAVWQNKNLYTANGGVPGKLFKYDTSTVGTDSATAWRYINDDTASTHTYRYARSPYGDYATEFYTGPTNNILFIPAQENETRMNVKLDRGNLTNIFQYNNLVETDLSGNTITGQSTIGQDLQFNVGLDPNKTDGTTGTGRKIPSGYPNSGVASVRVFQEESFQYNHLQNYRTKGTLRVAKPLNP